MLPTCPNQSKPPSFVISPATGRQETGGDLGRALTHPVPVFLFVKSGGGQPQPFAGLVVDYLNTNKVCGK